MAGADRTAGDTGQDYPVRRGLDDQPDVVNHFAYGFNRFVNNNVSYSYLTGEDWASLLGLENVGSHAFPVINWRGYGSIPREWIV